jgi:hypothetical protein
MSKSRSEVFVTMQLNIAPFCNYECMRSIDMSDLLDLDRCKFNLSVLTI